MGQIAEKNSALLMSYDELMNFPNFEYNNKLKFLKFLIMTYLTYSPIPFS